MVVAQGLMEARLLLRNGEQVVLALVIPLLLLTVGAVAPGIDLGTQRRIDVLAPGILALAVMSTAFTSLAIATSFERRYGVLKRLGASPLPRTGLLAGKLLAVAIVEALQDLPRRHAAGDRLAPVRRTRGGAASGVQRWRWRWWRTGMGHYRRVRRHPGRLGGRRCDRHRAYVPLGVTVRWE
jgi:hypothetical protein